MSAETITLGDLSIALTRKDVKNTHLSVHPPDGRVTLVVPLETRLDVARAFAASKLSWIRAEQENLRSQAREEPRRYVTRESHWLWGKHHLLHVVENDRKPEVRVEHQRIILSVRPGTPAGRRAEVMAAWHRELLHEAVPPLLRHWEETLGVDVTTYHLQRMKTKWGSCNPAARNIRLNTELVKKPRHLLEYVIVHELLHLLEPTHSERFFSLLEQHVPDWRERRNLLNELPLGAETWDT